MEPSTLIYYVIWTLTDIERLRKFCFYTFSGHKKNTFPIRSWSFAIAEFFLSCIFSTFLPQHGLCKFLFLNYLSFWTWIMWQEACVILNTTNLITTSSVKFRCASDKVFEIINNVILLECSMLPFSLNYSYYYLIFYFLHFCIFVYGVFVVQFNYI